MVLRKVFLRMMPVKAASALAIAACCVSTGAWGAMTLPQMKSLMGAAQLDLTLDKLFLNCGLPAAIADNAPPNVAKQPVRWNRTTMHLSAMDWDVSYGMPRRDLEKSAGWRHPGKSTSQCTQGLSQLQLHAKGHVGVLTVTKKPQGFGYTTTYREPKSLLKAHKVVIAAASLAKRLPVAEIIGRYGQADEILRQAGTRDRLRYWVLTRRDDRPELLYAVDFEIDGGGSGSYTLSTSAVDFVQQRLEALLKQWERDYVLD